MPAGVCAHGRHLSTCHHAGVAHDLPIRLLFDAVEAGRAALSERDERDVPAKLRAVAASSSRTLPPPMARRLLAEVEADPALRDEAAEALHESAGRASVLFLARPEGWEQEYEQLVTEHRSDVEERAASREDRRMADLERELKAARAKARDAVKRAEAVEAKAEARIADSRRDIKKAGKAASKRAAALEAELMRSETRRRELADELTELRAELGSLRAQRRKRDEAQSPGPERPSIGSDPVSLARALDHLLVRAQQDHEPIEAMESAGDALSLPAGISPDRADAVEWLLASGVPQIWVVDGHNLAHRLDPARFTDPELRVQIAEAFSRLRRQSFGPMRAVIVFDTGAPVGDSVQAAPGVDIIFAGDADAEVVRLAGLHGRNAVIVSSDGEVRHGAEAAGAMVIWSDAVVEFLRG